MGICVTVNSVGGASSVVAFSFLEVCFVIFGFCVVEGFLSFFCSFFACIVFLPNKSCNQPNFIGHIDVLACRLLRVRKWPVSRCNPRCSAGLFRWRSHVNEGAHWPRRATRTLQTLHDRCQMLSRFNRVHHAQIAGCTQPKRRELTGHALAWQHAWLYGASAIAQSRTLAPSIADKQDIAT